jgi:hypothetical protein
MRASRRTAGSGISRVGLTMRFAYPLIDSTTDKKVLVSVLEKKIVEASLRIQNAEKSGKSISIDRLKGMLECAKTKLDSVLIGETEDVIPELHHAIQLVDNVLRSLPKSN